MADQTFSGGWKRATLPVSRVPLKPGIDPEHAKPSDGPDPTYELSFVDATGAPQLPAEWSGGQYEQEHVGSGYVDLTPVSHEAGVGMLPGLDRREVQIIGGQARSQDLGAMDARDYERPAYQEDGSAHGEIVNSPLSGTSPTTLVYQEKGVGVGNDPDARSNRRITRRPTGPAVYDARWYDEQMRPRYVQTARGQAEKPAVPNRQVNTPTEARNVILRPDNWAAPIERRSAAQWDQAFTTDDVQPSGGDFGLGSWGL